jgi:hypothetical protein
MFISICWCHPLGSFADIEMSFIEIASHAMICLDLQALSKTQQFNQEPAKSTRKQAT